MSNQLYANLMAINEEKQNKIIPENIKNGVTIFGVDGTCGAEYLSYKTMAELNAQEDNPDIEEGQKAIVYGVEEVTTLKVGTTISAVKSVQKDFTLDTAITDYIEFGAWDYELENSVYIEIDAEHCLVRCGGEYSANGINYVGYWLSTDGLNYIGQEEYTYDDWMLGEMVTTKITYGETIFGTMRYNEDEKTDTNSFLVDLLHRLVVFGAIKLGGVYEYTSDVYLSDRSRYVQNASLVQNPDNTRYYDVEYEGEWVDLTALYNDIIDMTNEIYTADGLTAQKSCISIFITEMENHRVTKCEYISSNKAVNYGPALYFTSMTEYSFGYEYWDDEPETYKIYSMDLVNKTYEVSTSGTYSLAEVYTSWGDTTNIWYLPDTQNKKILGINTSNVAYDGSVHALFQRRILYRRHDKNIRYFYWNVCR